MRKAVYEYLAFIINELNEVYKFRNESYVEGLPKPPPLAELLYLLFIATFAFWSFLSKTPIQRGEFTTNKNLSFDLISFNRDNTGNDSHNPK